MEHLWCVGHSLRIFGLLSVSHFIYIYNRNIYYQYDQIVLWRNQFVATACLADTGFIITFTETPRNSKPGFGVSSVACVKELVGRRSCNSSYQLSGYYFLCCSFPVTACCCQATELRVTKAHTARRLSPCSSSSPTPLLKLAEGVKGDTFQLEPH